LNESTYTHEINSSEFNKSYDINLLLDANITPSFELFMNNEILENLLTIADVIEGVFESLPIGLI
jgi:hypothetical protein